MDRPLCSEDGSVSILVAVLVLVVIVALLAMALALRIVKQYEQGCSSDSAGLWELASPDCG
jgi:hypothetical protein